MSTVSRSATVSGTTTTEELAYTYLPSGDANAGLVATVTLHRKVGAGAWTTVRSVAYSYYEGTTAAGNLGDLRTATVSDANGNAISTSYYRYYTAANAGTVGYAHGLKYVLAGPSYARLVNNFGAGVDSLTDAQVIPYVDKAFQYDSNRRVSQVVVAGDGGESTDGQGTHGYTYTPSTNAPGVNAWAMKTVATLPDGNKSIVYTNAYGQVLLYVYEDAATSQQWKTYYRYDSAGRLVLKAEPSTVTGFSESYPDLVNYGGTPSYLSSSAGLLTAYTYGTSTTATAATAGDVAGYLKEIDLLHGTGGTPIPQETMAYAANTAGGVTVYKQASDTVYRNANGTGAETTSYSYTFFSGTNQVESVTTTLPTVTTGQNGSGVATSVTTVYDQYGNPVWSRDADGYLSYTGYDVATGAVVKWISDVNSSYTGDFTGLPSGWTTPSRGGQELITRYQVDALGRTTKRTDANGNVTYTVFDDVNHEVRTYAGWNSSTNMPTGPTSVVRDDWANGYTETLTMSATPSVDGGGQPTGAEPIANLQSLSRTYTNLAGQVATRDSYFDLSGLTYSIGPMGSATSNFYRTQYEYDAGGRLDRVENAQGTIYRTVYDGQGRAVSEWVGTNDAPTSGDWSPTNPAGMTEVRSYQYDGGGVGDSNLTLLTEYPGGGADNRVTQTWYDWRNRSIAVKEGVQATESSTAQRPIFYTDYDNLGRVVTTRRYVGDGVNVVDSNGDGAPDAPAAGNLRAQTTYEYDEQGRVFRTKAFSVNPATGVVSTNSLQSLVWYDARGNAIKSVAPGGLVTKAVYDGAGRVVKTYTTDGGGDSTWADAGTVTGDTVYEQVEVQYDANGNVLLTTTRQRFDNATATGELGSPTSGVGARVSFVANYYDAADRLTAAVNVGTNGGTAWTRPGTVPTRSATALVTSYAYDAAGNVQDVVDPLGRDTRSYYDALGRATKTIESYTDGVVTNTTNKTTEYTYNGVGMTSLTARLAGGGSQTTAWVYGVTKAGGSGIDSNDIVGATEYPDPTTGAASGSEREAVTVNALGQVVTSTDRNGTTHTYTYDVLGRQTVDAVTTLGAGVDGSVRRIVTEYGGQGQPYRITSYSAVSGGSVVNQVLRDFNGLGQLTTEWQSHGGAVSYSTTPKVQYAYSFNASGTANHSRLTSVTYPDGYQLIFSYTGGSNNAISRLSAIGDSTGTLETYLYLGLGTVVERGHPTSTLVQTFVSQTGSTGDAGDRYTGLDRFGRVVEQLWYTLAPGVPSTAVTVFDVQYGYDANGNVLWRNDRVNSSFSELYTYDSLNQLATFARGTLNGTRTGISGTPGRTQSWDYDALGNWNGVTTDGSTETRSSNAQNEYTSIGGATTPAYDASGNMTTDETGKQFVYDAWNRLVSAKNASGTTLETFSYDSLNRRVTNTVGGTTTDLYYSDGWQVLEERIGTTYTTRYVWSPVYVNAMISRDTDTSGTGLTATGTSYQRLWPAEDANWNVTGLVDGNGTVVERYAYDPFGAVTVYDANYAVRSGGSNYGWVYNFQGMRTDSISGLIEANQRWYSPTLGRWTSLDPSGFDGGDVNWYRMVGNSPIDGTDPSGLDELSWGEVRKATQALMPGIPTGMLDELERINKTTIIPRSSSGASATSSLGTTKIRISQAAFDRIKAAKVTIPGTGRAGMGLLYNELFHAYFYQVIEKDPNAAWMKQMILREAKERYNGNVTMVEEAMSEMMMEFLANTNRPRDHIPKLAKSGFGSPSHEDSTFKGKDLADQPVSEDIRNLTLYILLFGTGGKKFGPLPRGGVVVGQGDPIMQAAQAMAREKNYWSNIKGELAKTWNKFYSIEPWTTRLFDKQLLDYVFDDAGAQPFIAIGGGAAIVPFWALRLDKAMYPFRFPEGEAPVFQP